MPEQEFEESGRSHPGRLRDWILLASTVLGLLAQVGLHMVFTNTSTGPTSVLQTQAEETVRAFGEIRTRLDLMDRRLNDMHEANALLEQRLKYAEDSRRR